MKQVAASNSTVCCIKMYKDKVIAGDWNGQLYKLGMNDILLRMIKLYDRNLKKGTRVFSSNLDSTEQMVFADEGNRLAITGTCGDCNIRIWDFETDKCLLQLAGHKTVQYALSAPKTDNTRLLSGSTDGEVRLYVVD